ncbi:ABC transporter substrate-binding protein [Caldivirga sp.]|uniref:ABC transporter substrate-binding protein n=1 Tax=Caldivirga sp. TaxID=2080243 RepID=UPI003D0B2F7C
MRGYIKNLNTGVVKISVIALASVLVLAAILYVSLRVNAAGPPFTLPVPRNETLILVRPSEGYPVSWNPFIPNGISCGECWGEAMQDGTPWYINNYATGERIWYLFTGPPTPEDNYTVWIYHIRPGITWEFLNGTKYPFTAQDIVFTLNNITCKYPQVGQEWCQEHLINVTAPDNYTVIFYLKRSEPRFFLSSFQIVPKFIWEHVPNPLNFTNPNPPVLGPYAFYQVIPQYNNMYILKKVPDWWGAKVFGPAAEPAPEYIVFMGGSTSDVQFQNWVNGYQDYMVATDVFPAITLTESGLKYPGTQLLVFYDPCPRALWLNTQWYPLNYSQVRWAIAHIINYTQEAAVFPSFPETEPAKMPWADWPSLKYWTDWLLSNTTGTIYTLTTNWTLAAQLLESVGMYKKGGVWYLPNGTPFTLTIYDAGGYHTPLALAIVQALNAFGIKATDVSGPPYFWQYMAYGYLPDALYWLCTGFPWTFDPYYFYNGFWGVYSRMYPVGKYMYSGVWVRLNDPILDKLINETRVMSPTNPETIQLYKDAIFEWWKDLPAIPLVQTIYDAAVSTKYWVGWPTPDHFISWPPDWWTEFLTTIVVLHPTGAPIRYVLVKFVNPVNITFHSIDGQWYGPFSAGQEVWLPRGEAAIFILQGDAIELTPPTTSTSTITSTTAVTTTTTSVTTTTATTTSVSTTTAVTTATTTATATATTTVVSTSTVTVTSAATPTTVTVTKPVVSTALIAGIVVIVIVVAAVAALIALRRR